MRAAAIAAVLLAACAGHSHHAGNPDVTPPPIDAAPPPVDATPMTPIEAARASCQAGGEAACDALADLWGARELVPDGGADQGVADAALLATACDDHDDAAACFGLALMHKYGTAGAVDGAAAKTYFAKVRTLGDLNGFRGEPPSDEGKQALAAAQAACDAGRARACSQLGWAAFSGVQQDKDVPTAYAGWRRGCDLGSSYGCRWAGHVAYTHPEAGATDEAEALLRKACDLENPSGCDELGRMLELRGDPAAAAPEYLAACAGGSRAGCADAGMVSAAKGTPDDLAAAAALYRRACDAGDPLGCARLGAALVGGAGVEVDRAAAATAYMTACKGDEPTGCLGLAAMFKAGKCTMAIAGALPTVDADAATLLKAACKASSAPPLCRAVKPCK